LPPLAVDGGMDPGAVGGDGMTIRTTVSLILISIMLLGSLPLSLAGPVSGEGSPSFPSSVPFDDGPSLDIPRGGEFVENRGQWDKEIEALASGRGMDMVFREDGVIYALRDQGQAVKVSFGDGNAGAPVGTMGTGTVRNYLLGSDPSGWVSGVRSWRTLTYQEVWPGIDVRYTLADGGLKYDVIVGPGADPSSVRFCVAGAAGTDVRDDSLAIDLPGGASLRDGDLVAWYDDGEPVDVSFRVAAGGYGFSVDKDEARTLVIDPLVILTSTLLGGTYGDTATHMELDPDGDIVVAGTTESADYPVTPGAFCESYRGNDLVVAKMDRNCTQVTWATFIGGGAEETLKGFDIDDGGDMYATGVTRSADFPVTKGALQEEQGGPYTDDIYVLRLRSDGSALVYSTYIGSMYPETPGDIAVHDGRAYVTAMTEGSDFPYGNISASYYKGVPFVMVLSEDGSTLETIMSWYVTRSVRPDAIVIDEDGTVFIGGLCGAWDLPVTPGAYMTEANYSPRSFIIKCDPWRNETFVCSYFSKAGAYIEDMELDGEGNLYLAGLTYNFTWGGLELTEGAWCTTYKGTRDLFVTKMDANVTHVVYSTLVGGNSYDFAGDLAVSPGGVAVLVGWCWDATGLVTSSNAHDVDNEGVHEGFVVALSEDGGSVVQSTLMGGTHGDYVTAVMVTEEETLLMAGYTESKDFPVTEGAYQTEMAGNRDIFVLELAVLHPPSVPRNLTAIGGDGNITLHWLAPLDNAGFPILNYTVHRNDTDGGMEVLRVAGPATSFVDEEVEYGVYYTYQVDAFNGRGMSNLSNLATGRTVTLPDPPTNLTGSVLPDHIWLSWRTPLFTGGLPLGEYNLYRSMGDGPLQLLARVNPLLVSFADAQVEDRVTYTYVLAATNERGESRDNPSYTLRMTGVSTEPLNLSYTYGDRFIELNWTEPVEVYDLPIVRYHVFRSTGTGPASLVGVTDAPVLRLHDRSVEIGVLYRYHVVAENAKGMSGPSEAIEAMTRVRPDPPGEVEATALELFVRITWQPSPFDGASPLASYQVYEVDLNGSIVHLGEGVVKGVDEPRLVFLHEVAYDGISRAFYVTAVNAEGESEPSVEAWTELFSAPSRPLSPVAEWGDGMVSLEWTAPDEDGGTPVRSFALFRAVTGAMEFVQLATVPSGSLRYVDGTVANGVEYDYWLTAWNLAGESDPSEVVTVMPAGPPEVPRQVTAEGTNGSVVLRWGIPEWDGGLPIAGYRVYGISDGLQAELLAEVDADEREFQHGDLTNGVVYLYAVQAYSLAGDSELSPIVEGRPAGAPSAPQVLVAVWMDDMVYLTWSSPESDGGAPLTGYRIHRDDWGAANWTDVPGAGLMFSDWEVERNETYNYTLYAYNDVGPGPLVRISFTVPPQEDTSDDGPVVMWPWLLVGAAMAALAVAVVYWRRPRPVDYRDDEDEAEG
jgi:hypothetical protein